MLACPFIEVPWQPMVQLKISGPGALSRLEGADEGEMGSKGIFGEIHPGGKTRNGAQN